MPEKMKYNHTYEIRDNTNQGFSYKDQTHKVHSFNGKEEIPKKPKQKMDLQKEWDSAKEILKEEQRIQEIGGYKENEIGWMKGDYWNSWDKVKGHTKKILGHHEAYDVDDKIEPFKKIFLAHYKDIVVGKPQLVEQTQLPFPLIKEMVTKIDTTDSEGDKIEQYLYKYMSFDEKVDGRVKGYQRDYFSLNFRLYRVIDKNDLEYFIFSQEKLPNCSCELKGMIVEMEHIGELKRSFGVKKLARIFFLKEFIPSVKILSKEQIVEFTKTRDITEKDWRDFLDLHPNGNFNRFIPEVNKIRDAQILSGKRDGYPFHTTYFGSPGTGKSKGHLETLDYKFNECSNILEGGNSRIKMLTPSFKEKPANLGYLAKAERMGFIDEIGKLAEFELDKHQAQIQNIFGTCNLLYDSQERVVGSGNDNECRVQATAKFIDVLNPVSGRKTIYAHVELFDPTFLSRKLNWVQDDDEKEFIFNGNMVERNPPHTSTHIYIDKLNMDKGEKEKGNSIFLYVGGDNYKDSIGKFSSRDEFLTLFDTCNSFTCDIDEKKIQEITSNITFLAKEPMKSSVWRPRGDHHTYLLVDGITKHRCLFRDYDSTFTPKQEDYDLVEKILKRMVKGWDTILTPKEETFR